MTITNIAVFPTGNTTGVLAYVDIVLDDQFVVKDCKILTSFRGNTFIAMPGRKRMERCRKCSEKNYLRARYCNGCGVRLPYYEGAGPFYEDVVHPITDPCRETIHTAVMDEFKRLVESNSNELPV